MRVVCKGSKSLGRFAVYTGADDAPWSNPYGNISRIKIHSDMDSAGIIDIKTGSVAVENINGASTLFTHNLGYSPMLLGFWTIDGVNVPINMTLIVSSGYDSSKGITIGCDATNVIINSLPLGPYYGAVSKTISYTIYVFDVGVSPAGAFVRPVKASGIKIGSASVGTLIGYISSKKRYLYKLASGVLPLPRGRTIFPGVGKRTTSPQYAGVGFRQSINGYVVNRNVTAVGALLGNDGTSNATINKLSI